MGAPLSQDELDFWKILEGLAGGEAVLDFIPRASPDLGGRGRVLRPYHLREVAEALSAARATPRRICISVPPRFGKTETISHALAWLLQEDDAPETEIAYLTYAAEKAYEKSKAIQEICHRAGIPMRAKQAAHYWKTNGGAAFRAAGVGGPLTGSGARYLVVDDPFKNREEAESPVIREKLWEWFTSVALTRVEPGGSIIVVHTRWHDDDMIGRLEEGQAGDGWQFVNLPAILDEGQPTERSLWPERWPLEELKLKRQLVGPYDWSSLFMGAPRPKGGRLFMEPGRFRHHDPDGCYYVIGCDPAATEDTAADHSVIVVLACKGRPTQILDPYKLDPGMRTPDFRCEVVDLWRGQVRIPDLVKQLQRMANDWRAPVAVEAVGGFKAVPQMLRSLDRNLRIFEVTPSTDKFVRAQGVAAAWNAHRVLVPSDGAAPWVRPFLNEVTKFTGIKDAHDDQIDALSHAFTALTMVLPLARGVRRPGWREI